MPYNMKGGDTPENTKFMEGCVKKVMAQGKDKSSAIAICKSTYEKKQNNSSLEDVDKETEQSLQIMKDQYIKRMIDSKKASNYTDANYMWEAQLSRSDYDIDRLTFILSREI